MTDPAHAEEPGEVDAEEAADLLLRDLRSSRRGLSTREAQRRLIQYGSNELRRRGGVKWPGELARQLTHPLALLLWLAAALSFAVGSQTIAIAVLLVIVLNALFAFVQEMQAERAVEALAQFLPPHVRVLREGQPSSILAADLVPGDVVVVEEGDRIAADMRLISGAVEVDLSTLTGESTSALRSAELVDTGVPRLVARDLLFSGTSATGGEALGVVFATGMHTELGRIAALSERVKVQPSPLERQVRRVAWLIAGVAIAMAVAFVPVAIFGAGLSLKNSVVFSVGLLAGNVPEGLLPVITLALAVAVRALARRGALVKRLSAVETLGSTDVICTDKTGTLTENRMRPTAVWTPGAEVELQGDAGASQRPGSQDAAVRALADTAAACSNARLDPGAENVGDPTEVAVLFAARALGANVDPERRGQRRSHQYNFDARRKLMSTLDGGGNHDWLHTKGAPESVLPRCVDMLLANGQQRPLERAERERVTRRVESFADQGLRVLALARRSLPSGTAPPGREDAERDLCFLGLVAMRDPIEPGSMDRPPRPRSEGVIQGPMLLRAWLFLGAMVAGLSLAGYFYVLNGAGWRPGAPVGTGHPLHHAYLQATTMTFMGMIAGQIGTAFAVRTRRASLRSIGVFSNRYLLGAIVAELLLAAVFVYAPPLQSLLGTAGLPVHDLVLLLPYPLIVWGADELRRWLLRRHAPPGPAVRAA